MICPHCGIEVSDNSNFCTGCGASLYSAGTPASPPAYKLDLGKLLEDTFELYKRNFGTMCLIGLITLIVPLVFAPFDAIANVIQGIARQTDNTALWVAAIVGKTCVSVLQTITQWYIFLGIVRQCLYTARGGTGIRINLICPPFMTYIKFIGILLVLACIQFGIMLPPVLTFIIGLFMIGFSQAQTAADPFPLLGVIGVTFCVFIPCFCFWVWLTIRLHLAQFFLVDQDMGIADSIICGWRISSGNFWMLLIVMFVLVICAMLGVFLCCVGIIMTAAISWLGTTLAYLQLTGQPNCLDYPHS